MGWPSGQLYRRLAVVGLRHDPDPRCSPSGAGAGFPAAGIPGLGWRGHRMEHGGRLAVVTGVVAVIAGLPSGLRRSVRCCPLYPITRPRSVRHRKRRRFLLFSGYSPIARSEPPVWRDACAEVEPGALDVSPEANGRREPRLQPQTDPPLSPVRSAASATQSGTTPNPVREEGRWEQGWRCAVEKPGSTESTSRGGCGRAASWDHRGQSDPPAALWFPHVRGSPPGRERNEISTRGAWCHHQPAKLACAAGNAVLVLPRDLLTAPCRCGSDA